MLIFRKGGEEAESNANTSNAVPPLTVEAVPVTTENEISGRRVVDIAHITKQLMALGEHPRFCTLGAYKLEKEVVNGLSFTLVFFCDNCDSRKYVTSDSSQEVNDALVWGSVSVGIGYSQVEELMAVLNIPMMAPETFHRRETSMGPVSLFYLHF